MSLVIFKGNKDGLSIYIKDGDFNEIIKELDIKLDSAKNFFNGGKVTNFIGRKLTDKEKETIEYIVTKKHGIDIDLSVEKKEINKSLFHKNIDEGMTKFVRTTIRSGQTIKYNGNLVILGDVNSGSVVIAGGNIIILGALRGIAHAGCKGNRGAIIACNNLQSSQLRIADIIARSPDNQNKKIKWSAVASIKEDIVVIEPCLQKNLLL
ncbi:septum site-determining protein MinC [Abyssisolibacter fermentans]|uniref:septum site-determining protein MinC n=1 Tax=Abyssisolibacter fermentans TaxID=1766203 RepID=UPI000830A6EA|nr:septum site-determining protein MinC [Abyssisolibacter fermentans]